MTTVTHVDPPTLFSSPAFSQAVRIPADHDTLLIGGQNGVGPDGALVGPGTAEQAAQALRNVRACVEAAGGSVTGIVSWTILAVAGSDMQAGYAAFGEFWPADAPPPAITVAFVQALAVPGAHVEIAAVAALPPA